MKIYKSVLWVLLWVTTLQASEFQSDFTSGNSRHWLGASVWANRPQDWRLNEGRLECVQGAEPLRNVHLLTHFLSDDPVGFQTCVELGMVEYGVYRKQDFAGFLLGSGTLDMDYLARATIFNTPGKNHGLAAVLNGDGWLMLYDLNNHSRPVPVRHEGRAFLLTGKTSVELSLDMKGDPNGSYTLTLRLSDSAGNLIQTAVAEGVESAGLSGDIGLISNYGAGESGKAFWFKNWQASGEKLVEKKNQGIGAILGTLYTTSDGVLRMTAQLQAVAEEDPRTIFLEVQNAQGDYEPVASTEIGYPGWYGTFVVDPWDASAAKAVRVRYELDGKSYVHHGLVRQEPVQRDVLKIAAFTGNNNFSGSFDDGGSRKAENYDFTPANIWYPHNDISENVIRHQPDLLVWTGDQIYEHRPVKADDSGGFSSDLDYLYKWSFFYLAHNRLLANYPSLCLIDDHDIWQINLWGKGGAPSVPPPNGTVPEQYLPWMTFMWAHDQGYVLPGEWVNRAEGSQMNHMPPPYHQEPLLQGILPRYGQMNYAGVSFAFLEDRKHKSSPVDFVPESRPLGGHPTVKDYDITQADKPGAKLYGDKQLAFIREWAQDWKDCEMKIVVSQTIPANAQTGAGVLQTYPDEGPRVDFDSAGWPQSGRNKAIREFRKCSAFMIAGDQHLGSIIQHGVEDWNDSLYSFCVPAIGNQAPRRWTPNTRGNNAVKGHPRYTGEYLDACKNKITVWAASNPWDVEVEPGPLHDRATGYGIVSLDKKAQTITMECWPRYADSDQPEQQFEGWPKTIRVADNDGRKAIGTLPEIDLSSVDKPVIQVIHEPTGEIVYTTAVRTKTCAPRVFEPGTYTVLIRENGEKLIRKLEKQTER